MNELSLVVWSVPKHLASQTSASADHPDHACSNWLSTRSTASTTPLQLLALRGCALRPLTKGTAKVAQ